MRKITSVFLLIAMLVSVCSCVTVPSGNENCTKPQEEDNSSLHLPEYKDYGRGTVDFDKIEYVRLDANAVILATGLKHRKLGLDGEEALIGRGVSFCATCDGMFFRKKEVAVVGGGNTAVQDALVLSEYCSRVYLIHRRNQLRAEESLAKEMLKRENIEFIGETVIEELEGEENLQSLTLRNVSTGAVEYLPVAALFEAIGQYPHNTAFSNLVDLDENGYFLTDNECRTSCRGVFAAGDACRKNVRQLTTAVSDGTIAALSAVEYLR